VGHAGRSGRGAFVHPGQAFAEGIGQRVVAAVEQREQAQHAVVRGAALAAANGNGCGVARVRRALAQRRYEVFADLERGSGTIDTDFQVRPKLGRPGGFGGAKARPGEGDPPHWAERRGLPGGSPWGGPRAGNGGQKGEITGGGRRPSQCLVDRPQRAWYSFVRSLAICGPLARRGSRAKSPSARALEVRGQRSESTFAGGNGICKPVFIRRQAGLGYLASPHPDLSRCHDVHCANSH